MTTFTFWKVACSLYYYNKPAAPAFMRPESVLAPLASLFFSSLLVRSGSALLVVLPQEGNRKNTSLRPHTSFRSERVHYSTSRPLQMPRGVKKENLPEKICVTCGRPFTWRKKWERVWDEVTTCSKSCNRKRRNAKQDEKRKAGADDLVGNSDDDGSQSNNRNIGVDGDTTILQQDGSNSFDNLPSELLTALENASNDLISEDGEGITMEQNLEDGGDKVNDSTIILSADDDDEFMMDPEARRKAERKAAKKAKKAERRAQREGRGDPSAGQKSCDMCGKSVNLLIRCMYEEGQMDWKMVCGKCWNVASGGVVDGDAAHPHYRYGGLWKNRRAQK